jgi:hypothetical protein
MSLGCVWVEAYPHSDVVRMHLLIGRKFDGVGQARIKPVVNGGVFQDGDARDVVTVQLFALLAALSSSATFLIPLATSKEPIVMNRPRGDGLAVRR